MDNIWGFLLQTVSASLVAALLLVMKWLLADKLSPRWQYGVWSVLALRILVPASAARYVLLPVSLWLETWKAAAERLLTSNFSGEYVPVSVHWGLPVLRGVPKSVTDWLFVLYLVGAVLCLLWYMASYIRLRVLLRRGSPASQRVQDQIAGVCEEYGLKMCRAVAVPGLQSAFVCGVVRPVLVVPAEGEVDSKVLLHELLHLKYGDALQNILWCILRAAHWCNPFLHYVFDRIGNDMESLCDQRVLERLEGEDRREYGKILLSMANGRYARAPGTTSLSNGGKNIARRIGAIVRFKKYPKGMALVSVCIVVVLGVPAVLGTANAYGRDLYFPRDEGEFGQAMALSRLQRCGTVAGALDTYAKGLVHENGIYIAMASPLSRQDELAAQMRYHAQAEGWASYHLDSGPELEFLGYNSLDMAYTISNLEEQAGGSYTAVLCFGVDAFLAENGADWLCDEEGTPYRGTVVIPVSVRQEDGWVVTELDREVYPGTARSNAVQWVDSGWSWLREYTVEGETGTVTVWTTAEYYIENWTGSGYDDTPKPNAEFDYVHANTYTVYTCGGERPRSSVGIQVKALDSAEEEADFSEIEMEADTVGTSTDGYSWASRTVDPEWDGTVESGNGTSFDGGQDGPVPLPRYYRVRIFWDGECVEEFTVGEAAQ